MKHRSLSSLARLLSAVFVILIFNLKALGVIRYVTETGAGTQNGTSWLNASPSLQGMIDQSAAGDEVWVKEGTYKPTDTESARRTATKLFCFELK